MCRRHSRTSFCRSAFAVSWKGQADCESKVRPCRLILTYFANASMSTNSELFLGIDIGTTHVKAALIDAVTLNVVASAEREVSLYMPQPNFVEQNPEDWWQAAVASVREALIGREAALVRAIGLSGQMHGTVCIDSSGQPVRPAIIWADQRADEEMHLLRYRLG